MTILNLNSWEIIGFLHTYVLPCFLHAVVVLLFKKRNLDWLSDVQHDENVVPLLYSRVVLAHQLDLC
jgi:hypothetical protein